VEKEEEEGHLLFLDIDIYIKTDASLVYRVYWKPTHTNIYLHQNSHHHPANKQTNKQTKKTQQQQQQPTNSQFSLS
jgi:hypothetical protein